MLKVVLSILSLLLIISCSYVSQDDKHQADSTGDNTQKIAIPACDSSYGGNHHILYNNYKDSLLTLFNYQDSLNLWNYTGEFQDTLSQGEGSGWMYYIGDSMSRFEYGQFGCGGSSVQYFYVIGERLVMHRDIETQYNAPLGYNKKEYHAKGDSTEYGEREEYEELSLFHNDKIIYQLSADCGAPNSILYIEQCEVDILSELQEIKKRIL